MAMTDDEAAAWNRDWMTRQVALVRDFIRENPSIGGYRAETDSTEDVEGYVFTIKVKNKKKPRAKK